MCNLLLISGAAISYYALSFPGLEDTQALALSHRISAQEEVASVEYISKEEGLRYFERSSGYETDYVFFTREPLPIVLRVIPKEAVI